MGVSGLPIKLGSLGDDLKSLRFGIGASLTDRLRSFLWLGDQRTSQRRRLNVPMVCSFGLSRWPDITRVSKSLQRSHDSDVPEAKNARRTLEKARQDFRPLCSQLLPDKHPRDNAPDVDGWKICSHFRRTLYTISIALIQVFASSLGVLTELNFSVLEPEAVWWTSCYREYLIRADMADEIELSDSRYSWVYRYG